MQQAGVFDVVKDWPAVGPPFALSIVGTLGWVAAAGALALAARRQGAPRREWIFIALAGMILLGGHPFPAGTLAFGSFFIAALLHEFRAPPWPFSRRQARAGWRLLVATCGARRLTGQRCVLTPRGSGS